MAEQLVRLNIGGASFAITKEQLLKHPKTRLGQVATSESIEKAIPLSDGFLTQTNELYFDRSQVAFDWIINLYRNDTIHISETWCPNSFLRELDYWQIEATCLAPCCFKKVEPFLHDRSRNPLDILREQIAHAHTKGRRRAIYEHDTEFLNQRFGRLRKRLWIFMENPASSKSAFVSLVSAS